MKKLLVVVDSQYMFHRHLYRIREHEEKNNGAYMLSWNGMETARMYFALKDFMEIFNFAAKNGADMCVCLDSKSDRKDESTEYKANRGKLVDLDVQALENIESVFRNSGFSVIKEHGYEADDCIASVVNNRSSEYEKVIVFTPDSDLCVLVKDNVIVWRYKSIYSKYGNRGKHATFMEAHREINADNLSEVLSAEFKAEVPYNAVALYKCTKGDSSDGIPGIKGFGEKAFDKFVKNLRDFGVDFSKMTSYDEVERIIRKSQPILGNNGVEQALNSLDLIRSRTCESIEKQVTGASLILPNVEAIHNSLAEFGITSL